MFFKTLLHTLKFKKHLILLRHHKKVHEDKEMTTTLHVIHFFHAYTILIFKIQYVNMCLEVTVQKWTFSVPKEN